MKAAFSSCLALHKKADSKQYLEQFRWRLKRLIKPFCICKRRNRRCFSRNIIFAWQIKKAEDLSIKKLTKSTPAVKEMFDEVRREN